MREVAVAVATPFALLTDFLLLTYEGTKEITGDTVLDTEKVDPHLTATIVGSYLRHHMVGAGQLSDLITTVHRALGELGQPVQLEEVRTPAVSVRRSVSQDYVVCMDCGYRGKTLRRHISTRHGLNRDEYLRRWGLHADHPLTAPAYSERRSTLAKALGLGRKPAAETVPEAVPTVSAPADADRKAEATPAPKRRSRAASKSITVDVASEAVPAPTPVRKRRSRSRIASPEQTPSPTAES
jgi:predicted transcriptional regulator